MMAHSVGLVAKLAVPAWLFKNCWMVDTASKRTLTVVANNICANVIAEDVPLVLLTVQLYIPEISLTDWPMVSTV